MWGQPPSAVRASFARLGFPRQLSQSEIRPEFIRLPNPGAPTTPTRLQTERSFAPRTAEGGCPHIEPMPQAFYRRQLPHLQCDDRQHFVTFCTQHRWILPERIRQIVLECCVHDDGTKFDLRVAVVMPDHVHMIFTPLVNEHAMEIYSLAEIMDSVKGASAHKINKALERRGRVWQAESFDHVLFGLGWSRNGLSIHGYGRSHL
jgi:REP element-mobilizing transposase RayT